jgi:hypothetical protein
MITYGITVSNEEFEFKRLINGLQPYLNKDEEIVVLSDSNKVTKNIVDFCDSCNLKLNYFNFQNNFSDFKNELLTLSSKEYLFQIDADEQVPISLIYLLRSVAKSKEIDLLWIPRINVVRGASKDDIKNFNWIINEMGWEGFPDYQARFVNLQSDIRWHGEVHEILKGANNQKMIQQQPIDLYSILHVKEISKQKAQNKLYNTISNK